MVGIVKFYLNKLDNPIQKKHPGAHFRKHSSAHFVCKQKKRITLAGFLHNLESEPSRARYYQDQRQKSKDPPPGVITAVMIPHSLLIFGIRDSSNPIITRPCRAVSTT
ncbi:hypothetical protein VTN00DRAFT_1709 [Thermoascus crustaceus]|uniref:uncharacterized protein n=1 Tax=Thermoascus crustaceus TaxID=5088 RepID=UPI003743BA3B